MLSIQHALQYHYEGFQAIYKDVLTNTENSVDRLIEIVQETMWKVRGSPQVFRCMDIWNLSDHNGSLYWALQ